MLATDVTIFGSVYISLNMAVGSKHWSISAISVNSAA